MRNGHSVLAIGLVAMLALPLGACATTGSVKRAQASADNAGGAAQRAQSTADAAGTAAQSANAAAGRAQSSADAAGAAAQGANQTAASNAQATNARLDALSKKVGYLEARERARHAPKKRHKPVHHRPVAKPVPPKPSIPPYQASTPQ